MTVTQHGEDLQREVSAMRSIERAYARLETLPPKVRARVMTWAAEQFHGDDLGD